MRKWLLLVPFLFVGCANLSKPTSQLAIYDLGTQPITDPAQFIVSSSAVSSAPGLGGVDMRYRLEYKDPARVYTYTESRWLAPPAELISQRLKRHAAVAASPCKLRLELARFEQVFHSAQDGRGIIVLHAVVSRSNKPLAQREFTAEKSAESANARGGVAALSLATDEALHQLFAWIEGLDCSG